MGYRETDRKTEGEKGRQTDLQRQTDRDRDSDRDKETDRQTDRDRQSLFVCWLLNVPATCECASGTDLLRQFYVLPH